MPLSLTEILTYLEERGIAYTCSGASDVTIGVPGALPVKQDGVLCWARDSAVLETAGVEDHAQIIVLVPEGFVEQQSKNAYITVEKPRATFFELINHFFVCEAEPVIDRTAVVETKRVGSGVTIGAQSYIGPEVTIAAGVKIGHGVIIDCPATIGESTIIHSGVVIGTDGFGYYKRSDDSIGKIPHLGGVIIGGNVEIGANTCIDRGTLDNTVIEDGVKIDNLCHIAHNVRIGANSLVIAQSLVGGSTEVEEEGYIAPGATIANQLHVGRHALIGMGAVVTKDVPAGVVVAGVPAKVIRSNNSDLF